MITQTRNIVTVSEGIEAEAEFGARKQDMPGLFAILRKGIYSEPEETVLREYAVNAVDANISNGKGDVPIEITMPNTLDPNLKIRDSGPGLSQKDMF